MGMESWHPKVLVRQTEGALQVQEAVDDQLWALAGLSKSLLTQSFRSLISCLCSLSSCRSFWKEKFKGKKCQRLDVHDESSIF